jgi:hypothetical protein
VRRAFKVVSYDAIRIRKTELWEELLHELLLDWRLLIEKEKD